MSQYPSPAKPINGFKSIMLNITAGVVVALGGWVVLIAERVSKIESYERRIDALESGRTTPMAAETRAEILAIRREIEELRTRHKTLVDLHGEFMRRLIDTVKENKP